jgi:hypothetical protein
MANTHRVAQRKLHVKAKSCREFGNPGDAAALSNPLPNQRMGGPWRAMALLPEAAWGRELHTDGKIIGARSRCGLQFV